ncbi:MAG: hypothetical protein HC895_22900 [Leptolyngbyaceae cyanobacterium SM1_3_5]|nr:hypothetical protein [Leptolyngbyaceae cyanobacterium SM1_3_5]
MQTWQWDGKPRWMKTLAIALLIVGITLRFVHLDRKVYWYDETLTSLRIFGHTRSQLEDSFRGQIIPASELLQFQQPAADKDWGDTLDALKGNAEHPPLYYLLARLWASVFGSSIAAMRSFPAVTSLLVFPCIYWLCIELFAAPLTGWVAVAIVAVAPYQVLYAQEAREYALWTVVILLSCAAFLRTLRQNTRSTWLLYALTVALGLYTHILGGLVTIAHGLYLIVSRRWSAIWPFMLAAIGGLALFTPWLLVIFDNLEQIHTTTEGVRVEMSIGSLLERWLTNLNRVFLDIDFNYVDIEDTNYALLAIVLFIFVWLVWRDRPSAIFLLALMAGTVLPLLLPDLLIGGRRSGALRYLIPCYLAIQLAVAHFLALHLTGRWFRLGRTALLSLTLAGVLSLIISSQATVWWIKSLERSGSYPVISQMVNRTEKPLVIVDRSRAIGTLSLIRLFDSHVSLQLLPKFRAQPIPSGFSDVFVLDGEQGYFRRIDRRHRYRAIPFFRPTTRTFSLWRLRRE